MRYDSDSVEGRLLAGEAEAYGQVTRWIGQILTRPRFRLLREEWDDLHQEAMARLLESLRRGRFDASRDFRVYVQSIARYTARDAVVRRIRGLELESALPADPPGGEEQEDRLWTRDLATKVLEAMSEACRGLVRAYFFRQRSYDQISKERDLPVGTVKSRLFRCLEEARRRFSEPEDPPEPK